MRFFVEINLPDDCETISYTTDPLEKCVAVATEFDLHPLGDDCTVTPSSLSSCNYRTRGSCSPPSKRCRRALVDFRVDIGCRLGPI
jgi:hypothetical protein